MINNNRWLLIVVAKYTVRGLTLDRRLIDGFHTRRVYIYYVYVRVFLAAFILWVFFVVVVLFSNYSLIEAHIWVKFTVNN